MEEGMSFLEQIGRTLGYGGGDIRTYSPLALAFVGDCVYDLVIRTVLVNQGNMLPGRLHRKKSALVRAQAQAAFAEALLPCLEPEEEKVYRRGRNAHSHTTAKNASVADYRKATGLEALYGYLYLTGRTDRLLELIRKSLELTQVEL